MKQRNYSVHVHWDKRYPKKGTDLCPIQLSISIAGLQFKIGLKLYANKEDFDKAMSGKSGSKEVKELRSEIGKYVAKAEGILEVLPNPTREGFQRLFKSETDLHRSDKTDVTFLFEEYMLNLKKEERFKSAQNMNHALRSLKKYRTPLYFEDINVAFLKGYRSWMEKEGNSATTAQIYLRNLRIIFNKAIKDGYLAKRFYPFDDYTIGTSAKSKNVLYPEQVQELFHYQPVTLRARRAKDYWLFCYLCNGINFKDMVYMKYSNIKGDTIVFVREKTKRTNSVANKEIKAYLHPEMKRIIKIWGNTDMSADNYIFPILNNYPTAIEREKRRKMIQKIVNEKLRGIGEHLGFTVPLVLNLARHSFGTNLKLNGTPTSFITDALGHADGKTTMHYLKSIPDNHIKQLSETLLK
ncbi:MAG TPA: site-specific integrase [Flavipsychrobacter sp.]